MNELEYLSQQLNLIVGFLSVSDEEIYNKIKNHDKFHIGLTISRLYEYRFENFSNHITTSSLILGFTHFEDFVTKVTSRLLVKFPQENKIKVTITKYENLGDDSKQTLAEEQARRLIFTDKIKLINKIYPVFGEELFLEILNVNNIRNCLMHNDGVADARLRPRFNVGEKIVLTTGEIHDFGLKARSVANELWKIIMD